MAIAHQTDVGRPDDVQAVVQATLDRFGGIDAIANCAAVVDRNETMLTGGIDDFDQVVNVNLRGAWLLIRAGAKAMMGSGTPGAIVTVFIVSLVHHWHLPRRRRRSPGLLTASRGTDEPLAGIGMRVRVGLHAAVGAVGHVQ